VKDAKNSHNTFNARVEEVALKPASFQGGIQEAALPYFLRLSPAGIFQ
jgi:hypothetical protein